MTSISLYLCVNPLSVKQGIWRQAAVSKLQIRAGKTDISCSHIYRRGKYAVTTLTLYICFVHSLLGSLPVIYLLFWYSISFSGWGAAVEANMLLSTSKWLHSNAVRRTSQLAIKVLSSTLPREGYWYNLMSGVHSASSIQRGSLAKVHPDQLIRSVISNRNCSVSST